MVQKLTRQERRFMARQHDDYYRLVPMFRREDGALVGGFDTYVVHTKVKDVVVAVVPDVISHADASKAGETLSKLLGRDVIVLSSTVELLKVEKLTPEEVAKLFPAATPAVPPTPSVSG